MDRVVLRGDPHHLGTSPSHRSHVAVADAKRLDNKLRSVDQHLAAIGDLETQNAGGIQQALSMLLDLEDSAVVDPLALEHATRIVQAVAQHVQLRVAPGNERTVMPNDSVAIIVGDKVSHGAH